MNTLRKIGALLLTLACLMCCMPGAQAESSAVVTIPISVTLAGTPAQPADFTFVLKPDAEDNPMPASSQVSIQGAGTTGFGPITYDVPGDYTYQIYQVNNGVTGYTYDATVYALTVQVTSDNAGSLTATYSLVDSASGEKPDVAAFHNKYKVKTDIPKTGYGD